MKSSRPSVLKSKRRVTLKTNSMNSSPKPEGKSFSRNNRKSRNDRTGKTARGFRLQCAARGRRQREERGGCLSLARQKRLHDELVSSFLERLREVGEFVRSVPNKFTYPRDKDDEQYINLAGV